MVEYNFMKKSKHYNVIQSRPERNQKFFQAKLTVGPVDDVYETEADAMADKVMSMSASQDSLSARAPLSIKPLVQPKCAACEKEEKEKVQRKERDGNTEAPSVVNDVINSGGQSLDGDTRSFMENRFGYDFNNVKIHNNALATKSAQSINALAYTSGRNIVFNEGQYSPGTNKGKKLLAHELTHVVQQGSGSVNRKEVQREPLTGDPIHDPLLDQFSAETGVPRDQASQHSSAYAQWLASHFIAPQLDTSCDTKRQLVKDIVNESLRWIDDIYDQLIGFEADEIFTTPGTVPSADHVRVGAALQQTFHTNDWLYVQVIASRFYHIGRMLKEPNRVTIFCGGPGCTAAGSSHVGAYVDTPYQIHLCGNGKNIATFIHEMGHAVIPRVGIRNRVGPGGGITDRAYDHERVFHHLSPEESLDNAESYGILADALVNRRTGNIVAPQPDRSNCSNPTPVFSAFARAELWTRRAWQLIGQWDRQLGGRPLSNLAQVDLDFLNAHLSFITSTADLSALNTSLTKVYTNSYHTSLGSSLNCLNTSSSVCNGTTVGIASNGSASVSAVTTGAQSPTGEIDICSNWFGLSEIDRIKTLFVLFLLARPSGMVTGINMSDAFDLANFAKEVIDETLPAPATRDAVEHLFRDRPTGPIAP